MNIHRRYCSDCGTATVPYQKSCNTYKWYNDGSGGFLCPKCKWSKSYSRNRKQIIFLGKAVSLTKNPRTGICSWCSKSVNKGEIKRTNMHHVVYDVADPLANTVEICPSCHMMESRRLKQVMQPLKKGTELQKSKKKEAIALLQLGKDRKELIQMGFNACTVYQAVNILGLPKDNYNSKNRRAAKLQ